MNTDAGYTVKLLTKMVRYGDSLGSIVFDLDAFDSATGNMLLGKKPVKGLSTGCYRIFIPKGHIELALERIVLHFRKLGDELTIGSL